jgi:hypothetical protein
MAAHLANHLAAGHHSPRVVLLRSRTIQAAVFDFEIITYCSLPGEWLDRIDSFP